MFSEAPTKTHSRPVSPVIQFPLDKERPVYHKRQSALRDTVVSAQLDSILDTAPHTEAMPIHVLAVYRCFCTRKTELESQNGDHMACKA